nr:hypothetical protein [Tanacetum cinerariifolium]
METNIVKLVVEIESFGMGFDEFDKKTMSVDESQLGKADLSYVYALNELHLHEIRVVPSKHEADQCNCCELTMWSDMVTGLEVKLFEEMEQPVINVVLMRVDQEQKVAEDARAYAKKMLELKEKHDVVAASLAGMENRAVMKETMLKATLQYRSGQNKAQPSPRDAKGYKNFCDRPRYQGPQPKEVIELPTAADRFIDANGTVREKVTDCIRLRVIARPIEVVANLANEVLLDHVSIFKPLQYALLK